MSRAARKRRLRVREARRRRMRLLVMGTVAAVALTAVGAAGGYQFLKGPEPWPHTSTLKAERIGENSVVYDGKGNRMGVIQSEQNRTIVPLEKMGKYTPAAIVSIEDRRFWQHDGYDVEGIMRAGLRNIEARDVVEGGSTITQQLVRGYYKEITQEQKFSRKAKEATLARELEQEWSKKKILESYLNLVFFGNNAYGVQAAAQTYFSKNANKLTLAESALLAGLVQLPSDYDPFTKADKAIDRRDKVLRAMYDEEKISRTEYRAAIDQPIKLKRGRMYTIRRLPYFFDFVEKQLIAQHGSDNIRMGGLRIHTTIDPRMQTLAEKAISDTLNQPSDPEAAIVAIETKTGKIKAMASSSRYSTSKFNIAAQGQRQPGSSAKTWVLADFVRKGYNPDWATYTSRPLRLRCAGCSEWWEPKTYDHSYAGTISVASATVRSDNSVYAQMVLDMSPEDVAKTARDLGIQSKLEPVWSITLGSQVVTPLEQTNSYATIARGGVRVTPQAINHVTSPTGALRDSKPKPVRVLEDWQADKIVDVLERNMTGGTGTAAYFGKPSAGKTGTTDNHKDAWFCGMTPELTTCVWMGYDTPRPMLSVHGIRVAGGTFPAQMWRRFMEPALESKDNMRWFEPKGQPAWIPFSSTWQSNPSIVSGLAVQPIDPYAVPTPAPRPQTDAAPEPTPAPAPSEPKPKPKPKPAPAPAPAPAPEPQPEPAPAAAPA